MMVHAQLVSRHANVADNQRDALRGYVLRSGVSAR
jgi:hypothetical protein